MPPGIRPAVARLPREPGVYRFLDASGRVLYLGRATDLRARVASYWHDLGDRRHLAPMVAAAAQVQAVAVDSVHEAAWLERNLLEQALPRWNRTPGGQEVAVHVRLDAGPERPGLRVSHLRGDPGDDVAWFGPYLGGRQVRLAVAALHRVYPLAYAGRLAGAEAELAGKRGVRAADRDALATALRAVLARDPAAVAAACAALHAVRDQAAGAQAYETAARIEAELQAVGWITCPQRVTTHGGPDTAVCGWAGGVLVSFTVSGGRLGGWSQRRCPRPADLLAATPAGWRPFARRNAELAQALAV